MPGMLGDNERLREIMNGPISDLLQKLNGHDGTMWEYALKRFLRKEKNLWELTDLNVEVWMERLGPRRYRYDFVIVSVEDLGFKDDVCHREVNTRAALYGLSIPQLATTYGTRQPKDAEYACPNEWNRGKYSPSQRLIYMKSSS
jgi:hypothetical protein